MPLLSLLSSYLISHQLGVGLKTITATLSSDMANQAFCIGLKELQQCYAVTWQHNFLLTTKISY